MSLALGLYLAVFAAMLGGLIVRSRPLSNALLGLAGLAGLVYGFWVHGLFAAIIPFLILIVAFVQAASFIGADRAATFNEDEQAMFDGPLKGLRRSQARRLIDQGNWLEGQEGDVLIRESTLPTHLYFLAAGSCDVHSRGHLVGRVHPGQLIGEATVLGEVAAIATVTVAERSRFWCAQAEEINAFLNANPDARHALQRTLTASLREKLDAMNRAAAQTN
jgi:uncharacterized membrane protein